MSTKARATYLPEVASRAGSAIANMRNMARTSILARTISSRESTISLGCEARAMNGELGWLALVGAALFLVASVGTLLQIALGPFVVLHGLVVFVIAFAYVRSTELDLLARLAHNARGTFSASVVAASVGLAPVLIVPATDMPVSLGSVFWSLLHGGFDAVALSVMPLLVVNRVTRADLLPRLGSGGAAVAASLLAVVAYHAGFANAWTTEGYVLAIAVVAITGCGVAARNPLPAVVGQVVMHGALAVAGMPEIRLH